MLECEYMYKGASRDLGPCVSRARKFCSRCDVRYTRTQHHSFRSATFFLRERKCVRYRTVLGTPILGSGQMQAESTIPLDVWVTLTVAGTPPRCSCRKMAMSEDGWTAF